MLTIPAPNPVVGDKLAAEITAAGFYNVSVTLVGDNVEVRGGSTEGREIDERDIPAIQAVIDRHDGQVPAELQAVVEANIRSEQARNVMRRDFGSKVAAAAEGRATFTPQERDQLLGLLVQAVLR